MNKLIILSAFFLVSCASSNYNRRDVYQVRYTVREYYLLVSKPETKPKVPAKNSSKSVKKKASRLDCERVFKEVNQCMQK